nr:immunoglobulin heavy chain junction region [Mus musculus]
CAFYYGSTYWYFDVW